MTTIYVSEPIHPDVLAEMSSNAEVLLGFGPHAVSYESIADRVHAVMLRSERFPASRIVASPRLKVIARHGAGIDTVDVATAQERGITVTYCPGGNANAVAEHVFALVLALGRKESDEPFNSEDLALLTAVAGQVATAIENGRLYRQLHLKAQELGRMREFNENILESLDDGLVVFDEEERIVRWNHALESFYGVTREDASGGSDRLIPADGDRSSVHEVPHQHGDHPTVARTGTSSSSKRSGGQPSARTAARAASSRATGTRKGEQDK